MVTLLIRFRVVDYDRWRPGYEAAIERDVEVRSSRVWRGEGDPNLVVVMETHDSREEAEALMLHNPEIQEEMVRDGVDLASIQLDFLEDAGVLR
jgi:hypothetical protein